MHCTYRWSSRLKLSLQASLQFIFGLKTLSKDWQKTFHIHLCITYWLQESWLLYISGEFKSPTNQAIQLLYCVTKILADAYKTSFTSLWESVFNLDHELELWQNFYWTQLMHQKCNLLYCGRIIFENVLYGKFTLTLFPQKYLISLKWKRIFAIEKHW